MRWTWAVSMAALACYGASAQQAKPVPRAWAKFRDAFIERQFQIDPANAVYQGRHDFDGQLPDWSSAGLKTQADFYRAAVRDASALDVRSLSAGERFERDYLVQVAKGKLFWLEDADQPHRNPAFYVGGGLDPNVYIARAYAPKPVRMRALIKFFDTIPQVAANIKANLKTPMPLSFVNYGVAGFKGFADFYAKDARAAFADVKDDALQAQL